MIASIKLPLYICPESKQIGSPFPKGLDVSSQSVEITLESAPQSYTYYCIFIHHCVQKKYIHSSERGEGQPQMSESNTQFSHKEPSENERFIESQQAARHMVSASTRQQLFKSFLFLFLIMEETAT